jgi:competence transcription factor ComK
MYCSKSIAPNDVQHVYYDEERIGYLATFISVYLRSSSTQASWITQPFYRLIRNINYKECQMTYVDNGVTSCAVFCVSFNSQDARVINVRSKWSYVIYAVSGVRFPIILELSMQVANGVTLYMTCLV